MLEPRKGAIAVCGVGSVGLITEDQPKKVTYPDENTSLAWVGVHLTEKVAPLGSPWSSRHPKVIGYLARAKFTEKNLPGTILPMIKYY